MSLLRHFCEYDERAGESVVSRQEGFESIVSIDVWMFGERICFEGEYKSKFRLADWLLQQNEKKKRKKAKA